MLLVNFAHPTCSRNAHEQVRHFRKTASSIAYFGPCASPILRGKKRAVEETPSDDEDTPVTSTSTTPEPTKSARARGKQPVATPPVKKRMFPSFSVLPVVASNCFRSARSRWLRIALALTFMLVIQRNAQRPGTVRCATSRSRCGCSGGTRSSRRSGWRRSFGRLGRRRCWARRSRTMGAYWPLFPPCPLLSRMHVPAPCKSRVSSMV